MTKDDEIEYLKKLLDESNVKSAVQGMLWARFLTDRGLANEFEKYSNSIRESK